MIRAGALRVLPVPLLADNYAYLVAREGARHCVVVDPAEAQPVLEAAHAHELAVEAVWTTHKHFDHVGGNEALAAAVPGLRVFGPAAEAAEIPGLTDAVADGDRVEAPLAQVSADALGTPCHTAGHVVYAAAGALFSGDTLFVGGCGRFFEGSAKEMFANMRRLAQLPPETRVFCGHEYTVANLEFAAHAAPSPAIEERLQWARALRAEGRITIPSTIGAELETNLFLRAESEEELGRLRGMKDSF